MSTIGAVLCALLLAAPPAQAIAPSTDCIRSGIFKTCPGHGEITVSGSKDTSAHRPRTGTSTPNPVRFFACSLGVPKQVSIADAAFAAADCRIATPTCAQAAAADGQPREAVLMLRRRADGSWQYGGWNCLNSGPPQITAAMVRAQASRLIPAVAIGLAPDQATLVNIQTLMWLDTASSRALPLVTILGRQVQLRIRLAHVHWDFGDGQQANTRTAGTRYDARSTPCDTTTCPGYFGHIFRHTGIKTITATAGWSATFTIGAGRPVSIPGTVSGPSTTATIHVKQARGVLVPTPGGGH